MRLVAVLIVSAFLVGGSRDPTVCLLAPVRAPVVVPFRAPECNYCPGQRGIEYGVAPGTTVRVALTGVVSFSGVVAGNRYVVVAQTDGFLATYGMLADTLLSEGEHVSMGQPLGHTSTRLYFGLRLDGVYADPVPRIGVSAVRRRLTPTDGSRSRPSPEGSPRCRIPAEIVAASGVTPR